MTEQELKQRLLEIELALKEGLVSLPPGEYDDVKECIRFALSKLSKLQPGGVVDDSQSSS